MKPNMILKDRLIQHGDYKTRAEMTIDLHNAIDAYRYDLNDDRIPNYQLDALRMICVKMARIVVGDNAFMDHWVDIAGYSQMVIDELNRTKPNNKTE